MYYAVHLIREFDIGVVASPSCQIGRSRGYAAVVVGSRGRATVVVGVRVSHTLFNPPSLHYLVLAMVEKVAMDDVGDRPRVNMMLEERVHFSGLRSVTIHSVQFSSSA